MSISTCQNRHMAMDMRTPRSSGDPIRGRPRDVLANALLGLLAIEPMSGYDLTRNFGGSLAYVWSASHSQIYPELARLDAQGLIRVAGRGARRKKTYAITAAGKSVVRRWLTGTEPDRTHRDESFLRVFFLWLLDPPDARDYLGEQASRHRALLAEYQAIADDHGPVPDLSGPQLSFRIALEAGIRHEGALLEWAEWAERELGRRRGRR
jgi:DNA-binding PadR family transcriptional regulator